MVDVYNNSSYDFYDEEVDLFNIDYIGQAYYEVVSNNGWLKKSQIISIVDIFNSMKKIPIMVL